MTVDVTPLKHSEEFIALCADIQNRVQETSIEDVKAMLGQGEEFHLIDVRDADEFENFRIEGATFLSKGWVEAKIHTVVSNKDDKIVLYCGSGNRSLLAAGNLNKMGYTNVLSMADGIKAWVKAGYDVLKA